MLELFLVWTTQHEEEKLELTYFISTSCFESEKKKPQHKKIKD